MSLFDLLFPQAAAASHLHALSNAMGRGPYPEDDLAKTRDTVYVEAIKKRVDDLEGDVGFLALLLSSLLSTLEEKGSINRDDVRQQLEELDVIDGIRDGRVNIRVLKHYLAAK